MDNYSLTSTPKTPKLHFNNETGEFEISGRSIPENSIEFYRPLMEWLDKYLANPKPKTRLSISLEYFNTSSSKCLVEMFRKLEKLNSQSDVHVIWHYEEEDEDMMESGDDFRKIIKIPIELVVISDDD